jgi:hypothetical protein
MHTLSCPSLYNAQAKAYGRSRILLEYLAGTVNLCIHYGRTKDGKIEGRELKRLWGWVDADFAADLDTRRSHSGYVTMMNAGLSAGSL